jgi:SnoaL-like polyketide cyclase
MCACVSHARGTPGQGLGMSPTNRQLHVTGISIFRTAADELVERWQNRDMLGLIQQINEQPKATTYMAAAG